MARRSVVIVIGATLLALVVWMIALGQSRNPVPFAIGESYSLRLAGESRNGDVRIIALPSPGWALVRDRFKQEYYLNLNQVVTAVKLPTEVE